jgi:hypothetical protein
VASIPKDKFLSQQEIFELTRKVKEQEEAGATNSGSQEPEGELQTEGTN